MKIREVKIIGSTLRKEMSVFWPLFFFKCFIKKKGIFNKTHWSNEHTEESDFAKRLSLASAMYLEFQNKFGREKAFEIMKKLLLSVGCNEQWEHLHSLPLSKRNPFEFEKLMDERGVVQFNKKQHIKRTDRIFYFIIKRCIFKDFFTEAGTPELTKLFCEVDREFFPKAFPEFRFHRNGSWENTIAYGKDHCEFVFESKR